MSAPRDDSVYLRHIGDAIDQVEAYIDGITEEEFLAAPLIQDGVIRQIQIIGEAAKRLSPKLRSVTLDIPWTDIAGMRDKLVHDYMGVDMETVWYAATRDLPALRSALRKLL